MKQVSMTAYPLQIISVEQMKRADSGAAEKGISSLTLMENAGTAVAEVIMKRFPPQPVIVLCGPGNNGGDGFVVARLLKARGFDVQVALTCDKELLKGDAATMASRWNNPVLPLATSVLEGRSLVVDALFGIGLSRVIESKEAAVIDRIKQKKLPVVSIDIPSGIDGDTGAVLGAAVEACITVTFCRKKPGQVLLPGKQYAGEVVVAPIGIPETVFADIEYMLWENHHSSWAGIFPFPRMDQHKYKRGHVVIKGGDIPCTGAASMSAKAALRVGAGLVTIACSRESLPIYASRNMSVMTSIAPRSKELSALLKDERKNTVVIGPGNGVNAITRDVVVTVLRSGKHCVLDADALTVFEGEPWALFELITSPTVLTPHEGEFSRLFPSLQDNNLNKITRASEAAAISNAVIVLKGSDTVIAHPDGRVAVNTNAPGWLATAGSGDVLSGIIAGIMANGVDAFTAACMANWLHGEAANIAGIGMIAEELPDYLPVVLRMLYDNFLK